MYTDEQEKLIECFNRNTSGIWKAWKESFELSAPFGIHLEEIYRTLYAVLAPIEPELTKTWSHKMTVVSSRGDGMLETNETLYMPSAEKEYTYEFFVQEIAYIKTITYDRDPDGNPWVFTIYAPSATVLERIVFEFKKLILPIPEIERPLKEEQTSSTIFEKGNEGSNVFYPRQIFSVTPSKKTNLLSLKEYLEKMNGIANLEYDFLYNLAECEYGFERLDFNFKNSPFFVSDKYEGDLYKWDFYIKGECSEEFISDLVEYMKLFE